MTRHDDAGGLLEGDGTEDTVLDGDGDNCGDAGDRYQGSLRFGTTAAEHARGQSLDAQLAQEEPEGASDGQERSQGRRDEQELSQLMTGGDGSHSRTDPDLIGLDRSQRGLSAEEAAMHMIP